MVRYADGPTTEATVEVAATPEEVWPLVTDIALPVARSDELQSVEWVEGCDGPAVGAAFLGHNRRGELAWTSESVITEMDPPHRFTWVPGHRAEHGAYSTFTVELTPLPDGGTRVCQRVTLGPGRSGLTWAIRQDPDNEEAIVAGRLAHFRTAMAATLEELASRLTSG